MEKMVVHICCGVDSVYALRYIKQQMPQVEMVGFFYDPNIHPQAEYELRWIETKRVCDSLGVECIKGEYELDLWLAKVKGYENEPERGERCTICHDLRLEKSAQFAKQIGARYLTTVLMMSPKKDFEVLREVGESIANRYGIQFLSFDFRKNGGIEKMNQLSKQQQLYHQNYCGCIYGIFGQFKDLEFYPQLVSFSKGRLAGSTEELLFIKQLRLFAQNLGLECEEQQFSFIGWRLISSVLKINSREVKHKVLPYSSSIKGVLRDRITGFYEMDGKTIYKTYKSNLKIWKVGSLDEFLWYGFRLTTDPVIVVEEEIQPDSRIEVQIKAEFDPSIKSQNLIVGCINSTYKTFFYSDTDYYGKGGFSLKEVADYISENVEKIKQRELSVVVCGANFVGQLGRKVFEESLGSLPHTSNLSVFS